MMSAALDASILAGDSVLYDRNAIASQMERSPIPGDEITDSTQEQEIEALAELSEEDIWCCPPPKVVAFVDHGCPDEVLHFGAAFESGNLFFASRIADTNSVELEMVFDCGPTPRSQWFYYAVRARQGLAASAMRFSIVNFTRSQSLQLGSAFAPLTWSTSTGSSRDANPPGWRRQVTDVSWSRTDPVRAQRALARQGKLASLEDDSVDLWTLSFTYVFDTPGIKGEEIVFFSYSMPYTVSHLRRVLGWLQSTTAKKRDLTFDRSILCETEGSNTCECVRITTVAETQSREHPQSYSHGRHHFKEQASTTDAKVACDKPVLLLLGRQCAEGTSGSWALQGLLRFLTGESPRAQALRNNFEIVCVPMLDVDGVLAGSNCTSLGGQDPTLAWGQPCVVQHPVVHAVKALVQGIIDADRKIACVIDFHGQPSRRDSFFILPDASLVLPPHRGVSWCFSELPTVASTCSVDVNAAKFSDSVRHRPPNGLQAVLGQIVGGAVFNLEVSLFGPTSLARRMHNHRASMLPTHNGRYPRARWLTLAQDRRVRRFFHRGVGYCGIRMGSVGLSVGQALFLCSGFSPEASPACPMTGASLGDVQMPRTVEDLENEELTPWTPRADCPALRMTAGLPPLDVIAPEALGSRPLEQSWTNKDLSRKILRSAPYFPGYFTFWRRLATEALEQSAGCKNSALRSIRQLAWSSESMVEGELIVLKVPQLAGSSACGRLAVGRGRCCCSSSRLVWDTNDEKVFRRYCPWLTLGDAPTLPEVARSKEEISVRLPPAQNLTPFGAPKVESSQFSTNGWIDSEASTACVSTPSEDASVDSCSEVSCGSLECDSDYLSDDSWASSDWSNMLNSPVSPRIQPVTDFAEDQEASPETPACSNGNPPSSSSPKDVHPLVNPQSSYFPKEIHPLICRSLLSSRQVGSTLTLGQQHIGLPKPSASSSRASRQANRTLSQPQEAPKSQVDSSLPSLNQMVPMPISPNYHLNKAKFFGDVKNLQMPLTAGTSSKLMNLVTGDPVGPLELRRCASQRISNRNGGFRGTRTTGTIGPRSLVQIADPTSQLCGPSVDGVTSSPSNAADVKQQVNGELVLPQPNTPGSPSDCTRSSRTRNQLRRNKTLTDLPLLLHGRQLGGDSLCIQSISHESRNSISRPSGDNFHLTRVRSEASVLRSPQRLSASRGH